MKNKIIRIFMQIVFVLGIMFLETQSTAANGSLSSTCKSLISTGDSIEERIDYLCKIYFSGENAEGLKLKCIQTIQALGSQKRTPGLEIQYKFLGEIKEQIELENTACDILEIFAAGIYEIDQVNAIKMGVRMPGSQAKRKAFNAKEKMNQLKEHNNALYQKVYESDSLGLSDPESKIQKGKRSIVNVNEKINNGIINTETAIDAGNVIKSLVSIKKKDKPCKEVGKKEIVIGNHQIVNYKENNKATQIMIAEVSASDLRKLSEEIKKKKGVESVEKNFSEEISTISVVHDSNAENLADWLDDKMSKLFKIVKYDNKEGTIELKKKE